MTPDERLKDVVDRYLALMQQPNERFSAGDDVACDRFVAPMLTSAHVPPHWRYDCDGIRNPQMIESFAVQALASGGAILFDGMYYVVVTVVGGDGQTTCALVTSPNGIDQWRFIEPILLDLPSVSAMRLTVHEDGWIYGTCQIAGASGLVRTKDLRTWTVLTAPPGIQELALHPEYIGGWYGWYRSTGHGLQWWQSRTIDAAELRDERKVETPRLRGVGAVPIKTPAGWLHVVTGMGGQPTQPWSVLDVVLTASDEPWRVIQDTDEPLLVGGISEPIGSVASHGVLADTDGGVKIYYCSGGMQLQVATSTVDRLVAFCQQRAAKNKPTPALPSRATLLARNQRVMDALGISY